MLSYVSQNICWFYTFSDIKFIKQYFSAILKNHQVLLKSKKHNNHTKCNFQTQLSLIDHKYYFSYSVYFLSSPYTYWRGPTASWARTSISLTGPVLWTKGVTVYIVLLFVISTSSYRGRFCRFHSLMSGLVRRQNTGYVTDRNAPKPNTAINGLVPWWWRRWCLNTSQGTSFRGMMGRFSDLLLQ